MLTVRPIHDKTVWEAFVRNERPNSFLQSWNWGEMYVRRGINIERVGVYDHDTLRAVCFIEKIRAKRGSFLFCPHGPVVQNAHHAKQVLIVITNYLQSLAEREGFHFIRFSPLFENTIETNRLFNDLGYKDAPVHMMHPEIAWVLDISKSEEEIISGMRKTTRHAIKNAENGGVQITMTRDPHDVHRFAQVYEETFKRQHFAPFSHEYLRAEFDTFADDNDAVLFFAEHNDTTLGAALILFYNDTAFYHHGASGSRDTKIPASQLLQWRIIQEAKRRGCTRYNFWGISPDDKPNHPWAGLSRFKKGFGGYPEYYVHAKDLPLSPRYYLNVIVERARRFRRGL